MEKADRFWVCLFLCSFFLTAKRTEENTSPWLLPILRQAQDRVGEANEPKKTPRRTS